MARRAVDNRKAMAPLVAVITTVLLWASSYLAIAIALQGFSPAPLAALRYVLASIALFAVAQAARIGLPRKADIARIAMAGFLGIAAYNMLLNTGQTLVNAGTAVLLININPVFAALLARAILKERMRPLGWIGIAVAFAGAALIGAVRAGAALELEWGALYVLAAAFCFALQWVLQKPLLSTYSPLSVATWVIWSGTAWLVPFVPAALREAAQAPLHSVAAVVFLGLGPAALAHAIWNYALAHYPVSRATSFLYLVPPVTLTSAYFVLNEIPRPATLVGGALTLAGVVIVNSLGREPAAKAEPLCELRPAISSQT